MIIALLSVVFVGCMAVITILAQFELVASKSIDIQFEHNDSFLNGALLIPKGEKPFPVVLFIHGDGPQDRFAGDSYALLINAFLEKGIACFTWDKKGVGQSSGNWLHQDMSDRADEALAALKALESLHDIDANKMGYIGFSQAGWVIPEIAKKSTVAKFYIVVGGAISWLEQSKYITRSRLLSQGFAENEIKQVIAHNDLANEKINSSSLYADYLLFQNKDSVPKGYLTNPVDPDRFRFLTLNRHLDVSKTIENINTPLLGIWGQDDLNVDAVKSYATYQKAMRSNPHNDFTLLMYQGATHAILNAKKYNYHLVEQWPLLTKIAYLLEGKGAYSEGYLDVLGEWANRQLHKD